MHRATSLKLVQGEDNSARQTTSRPVSGVWEVEPKRAPTLVETAADAAWAPSEPRQQAQRSTRRCDWG